MMDAPKLHILVLSDVNGGARANPFTVELIKSFWPRQEVQHVDYGSFWLATERNDWDIVLVQWPELLVERDDFLALAAFEQRLADLKTKSIIVTLIHNIRPHYRHSDFDSSLYSIVFSYSNAFVHLGQKSVEMLHELYPDTVPKPYVVVPHGNYRCFGPVADKLAARERLNIPLDGVVVLVFGELRAKEEFDLAMEAIKADLGPKKSLLIAGRVPLRLRNGRYGRITTHAAAALRSVYFLGQVALRRNIHLHERAISAKDVSDYVSCADIVFVARKNALNSGNVALGFTYGKIVVGPDIGNIGEVLRKAGNPVYDPSDRENLKSAMEQAYQMLESSTGQINEILSREAWDWGGIARDLITFFKSLRQASTGDDTDAHTSVHSATNR
jgi:beta-1,4-mannosyltransferase